MCVNEVNCTMRLVPQVKNNFFKLLWKNHTKKKVPFPEKHSLACISHKHSSRSGQTVLPEAEELPNGL